MSPIDPALIEVPAALLAEYGLKPGWTGAPIWRCEESEAMPVLVSVLRVPAARGLDPERLRRILSGVAAGAPLPPVPVFREFDDVVVLDGMHRVAVARALGFTHLPCIFLDLNAARDFYCYPEGQR